MQRNSDLYGQAVSDEKSEALQRQIQALSSRDWQLWSIGILVMLVLSAGFLAVIFPAMSWHAKVDLDGSMLPQFFFGFVALIILFNVYVISQKRTVNQTRHELIRELVFSERMESLSMLDPVTQLINHRGIDHTLNHEIARANRLGTDLSLMIMKLETLPIVRNRYGNQAGDRFVAEVGTLLKRTFRGSDVLARFSTDEFMAILPNTSEQQAESARKRVQESVDAWNLNTKTGSEISFAFGIVAYVTGSDPSDLIRTAQRNASAKRSSLVPIFVPSPNSKSNGVMV